VATVAMTGGTPAPSGTRQPSIRQQAAQRAVKAAKAPSSPAPRVIAQHAQKTTASLPGAGLVSSAPHPTGAAKPPGGQTAKSAAPKAQGPTAFNPITGFLNSQQLGKLANEITKQNMESELSPLRQQAKEIGGTESTVANRYSGYSNATDSLLQGVGQQAQEGAKTFENQAADAALKAGEGINQTGQTAVAQNGGYLDPQVQAELNAQGKLAAGVGSAQNSLAATVGENETGFMGNLRAAAAQRALEGQRSINTLYGGESNKNQAEQDKLVAKQPSEAKSLAVELGQKQFTDYATGKSLGIKQQTANTTSLNDREKTRTTERGQNITATKDAAQTRIDERKIAETERHNRASEETGRVKAEADLLKANAGASKVQREASGQIGTAYSVIQRLRSGPAKGRMSDSEIREVLTRGSSVEKLKEQSTSGKSYSKSYVAKYPAIKDQALITAAMELWNWHKVKPATAKELERTGISVPPNWTNGSFQGF
jgi:hypothetical protein